jgi:uroporphyrinogen decarboxylase
MNTQEKYLACMNFDPSRTTPKWEYGYWAECVREWYDQGLEVTEKIPDHLAGGDSVRAEVMGYKAGGYVDQEIHQICGLDNHQHRIPVDNFIFPRFEEKIVEDHPTSVVIQDGWGILRHKKKDGSSLERFISGPVKSLGDWEKLAADKFQPDTKGRFPSNWQKLVEEYRTRDYPLVIGGGQGFFGSIRYLLGEVEALTGFIKTPELIHAINDELCNFWIGLYDLILQDIQPDSALIWEDMCYKNGPLISPAMVEEFMLPYYKRLCGFFKDSGVEIIHVDTDGDAWSLIPLFLEGGVTGIFPNEVNANMDVLELRKSFPDLQLLGGVDKMNLIKGKEAIDLELEMKLKPTLELGGFIPTVDHLVPPGVSWETFKYYRMKLNELIDSL